MKNASVSGTVLAVLAGLMLGIFLQLRLFNDGLPGWRHIVTSDGRGYYAYLPAFLLDRDPTFRVTAARERAFLGDPGYVPSYLVGENGLQVNKYFIGEALLLTPFFLTGTLAEWLSGAGRHGLYPAGYTAWQQIMTGLGTLFYLFAGLVYLRRLLFHFKTADRVAAVVITVILAGTNLFYYSLWQPTMSHTFSFFAVNGFLWYMTKTMPGWQPGDALRAGLFLGLAGLIRPTNLVIVLLIPFLATDRATLIQAARTAWQRHTAPILFLAAATAVLLLQGLAWYAQTGRLLVWSYQGEGFDCGSPRFADVLFSFRKGLFIYTPVLLLTAAGFIYMAARRPTRFIGAALFFAAATWIIASWWNWYYGDGFGMRPFIDYYGVFAIILAAGMGWPRHRASLAAWGMLLIPAIMVNMVQTWQYTHGVIQPNSMNEAKYRHIFLRTDPAVLRSLGGNDEMASFSTDLRKPAGIFQHDFEKEKPGWSAPRVISTASASSGSHAGFTGAGTPFSPGIAVRAADITPVPGAWFIRGEVMIRDSARGASDETLVVLSMDSVAPGRNWWMGFRINDVPAGHLPMWSRRTFAVMTPRIFNPEGILKVYLWNTGNKPLLLDDFRVEVFGER